MPYTQIKKKISEIRKAAADAAAINKALSAQRLEELRPQLEQYRKQMETATEKQKAAKSSTDVEAYAAACEDCANAVKVYNAAKELVDLAERQASEESSSDLLCSSDDVERIESQIRAEYIKQRKQIGQKMLELVGQLEAAGQELQAVMDEGKSILNAVHRDLGKNNVYEPKSFEVSGMTTFERLPLGYALVRLGKLFENERVYQLNKQNALNWDQL